MNQIELTLRSDLSGAGFGDEYCLFDQIAVDGVAIDEGHAVSPWELVGNLYVPGASEIFTCGCGHAGCAGIHGGVLVRHAPGIIRWRYRTPMSDAHFAEPEGKDSEHDNRYERWRRESQWREFSFDRAQMVGAIEAALCGVRRKLADGVIRPRDNSDFERLKTLTATRPYRWWHEDSPQRSLYLLAEEEVQFFLEGSFVSGAELGLSPALIQDFAVWRADRPVPLPADPRATGNARLSWLEQGRTLLLCMYREGLAEDVELLMTYGVNWDRDTPVNPWEVVNREVPRSALDTTSLIPGVLCVSADSAGMEAWIKDNTDDGGASEIIGWMGQFYGSFLVPLDLERRFADWGERVWAREDFAGFDWWAFHSNGIALMRELKSILGNRCRLVYLRSDEDPSEDSPRQIDIGKAMRFSEH